MDSTILSAIIISISTMITAIISGIFAVKVKQIEKDEPKKGINRETKQVSKNGKSLKHSKADMFLKAALLGGIPGLIIGSVITVYTLRTTNIASIPPTKAETPSETQVDALSTESPSDKKATITADDVENLISDSEVIYQTEFESMSDFIQEWQQDGSLDLIDGYLVINGKDSGVKHKKALKEGDGFLTLFRYQTGTDANIVLFNSLGNADKYIGIKPSFSPELKISLGYDNAWKGGQSLAGNLEFESDHWYYVLVQINTGGEYYIVVWDKDNSSLIRDKHMPMGSEWENLNWYGSLNINYGHLEIDLYKELRFNNK